MFLVFFSSSCFVVVNDGVAANDYVAFGIGDDVVCVVGLNAK